MVLATSPPHDELQPVREMLEDDHAIDGQTTANIIGDSKPAPEVFLRAGLCRAPSERHPLRRASSADVSRAAGLLDRMVDYQGRFRPPAGGITSR